MSWGVGMLAGPSDQFMYFSLHLPLGVEGEGVSPPGPHLQTLIPSTLLGNLGLATRLQPYPIVLGTRRGHCPAPWVQDGAPEKAGAW